MGVMSWTERADKRGLDPLGIQNAGIALYQSLVPGISNVTLRVRYYGFYCWVSYMYANADVTTDRKAWRTRIRRAEAALALISSNAGNESGVGGIDWANYRLGLGEEVIDFVGATDDGPARQYLAQSLFNGAYFTQMFEMGIFVVGENGIERTHNVTGVDLAKAFGQSIGTEVEALLDAVIKKGVVTRAELASLAPASPGAIPLASNERSTYEDLLFARLVDLEKDVSRARTLRLILETAARIGRRPDAGDIRWALFDADFTADLEGQRVLWEAYQCQDLFQVANAALLEWSSQIMGDAGKSIAELTEDVSHRLVLMSVDQEDISWGETVQTTDPFAFDFEGAWNTLIGRRGSVEDKAWLAIQTIAAIASRLQARPDLDDAVRSSLEVRGNARSIVSEIDWLQARSTMPIAEIIPQFIVDRVVRRHSWVAMLKLRRQRDYTFLFELRDGRFVRRRGYAPAPNTPRLDPSVQFLVDIGLIGTQGLTQSGSKVLEGAA